METKIKELDYRWRVLLYVIIGILIVVDLVLLVKFFFVVISAHLVIKFVLKRCC